MITDREHFHGVALARMLSGFPDGAKIATEKSGYRNSYVLNDKLGVHIKFATGRMSPWSFTFVNSQIEEIQDLKTKYGDPWVLFVCGFQGITGIRLSNLESNLPRLVNSDSYAITITRRPGHSFSISNPGAKAIRMVESSLARTIAQDAALPRFGRHETSQSTLFNLEFGTGRDQF